MLFLAFAAFVSKDPFDIVKGAIVRTTHQREHYTTFRIKHQVTWRKTKGSLPRTTLVTSDGMRLAVSRREVTMNKNEIKGAAKEVAGRVKEATGTLLKDDDLEAKGAAERLEGEAQRKVGTATRKVGEAVEQLGATLKK